VSGRQRERSQRKGNDIFISCLTGREGERMGKDGRGGEEDEERGNGM
jgi:hypothetical protein